MSEDRVLCGTFFMNGDEACAEGAISAGCRFFAGYPITPATEVAERMSERLPHVGGVCIQMEDEMASMNAVLGASWAGMKAMTATSGPGFSLMMENLGLGVMLETPCVLVSIQRAGPSTGLPTMVAQGDMMQARWGSHGSYEIIALVPSSPQEIFDLTITAFNLSERYRVPVRAGAIPALQIRRGFGPPNGHSRRGLPFPRHRPHPRRERIPGNDRRGPGPASAPAGGQDQA